MTPLSFLETVGLAQVAGCKSSANGIVDGLYTALRYHPLSFAHRQCSSQHVSDTIIYWHIKLAGFITVTADKLSHGVT